MALYRDLSLGEFKCANVNPKIVVPDYLSGHYSLKIRKDSIKKFCLNCIRDSAFSHDLSVIEDDRYFTIRAP